MTRINLCFAEDTEEVLREDFAGFKPQAIDLWYRFPPGNGRIWNS